MITITRTDSNNPDFKKLTDQLDIELCRIYSTQPEDFEEYNRIIDLGTVVLVYAGEQPVACGCFKKFDETTVQLKRMFVDPAFRGKGIASAIVGELESWAKETGNTIVILETGNKQQEAISMYHKLGYSYIENYLQDIETGHSICMRKLL